MTRYSVDLFESNDMKGLEEQVKLFCFKYKIQVVNVSYTTCAVPGSDTVSYSVALAYSYSEKDYYTTEDEIKLVEKPQEQRTDK